MTTHKQRCLPVCLAACRTTYLHSKAFLSQSSWFRALRPPWCLKASPTATPATCR